MIHRTPLPGVIVGVAVALTYLFGLFVGLMTAGALLLALGVMMIVWQEEARPAPVRSLPPQS